MQDRKFPDSLPTKLGVNFKHVRDFPGYAVGDNGSVWSCRKVKGSGRGKPVTTVFSSWHEIKPQVSAAGYLLVCLMRGSKKHSKTLHRIVAEAFIGECQQGMQCCHENGNRKDSRATNLRWDTPRSNAKDKEKHKTIINGSKHHNAKLTVGAVSYINEKYKFRSKTHGQRQLAKMFEVTQSTISSVIVGDTWHHVSKN